MLDAAGDAEGARAVRQKANQYNKELKGFCQQNGLKYRTDRVRTYGAIEPKKVLDISGGSGIIFTKKQLGKKFGKHCSDWGLDPSSSDDRDKMKSIVCSIKDNCDEKRIGAFNGQSEDCLFFIKGEDVVITKPNDEFVTVLKGGKKDGWVENARRC